MQEHAVTVGGTTHALHEPFFVIATQNPIEKEGTYPLPEAQLDRFLLKVLVSNPGEDVMTGILARTTGSNAPRPPACFRETKCSGCANCAERSRWPNQCFVTRRAWSPRARRTTRPRQSW